MWDNDEWAANHLRKRHHGVSTTQAWEAAFESGGIPIRSPDQLRFPPYTRYWKIGKTEKGLLLFVVWESYREELYLITAFVPNQERIELYEKLKKKRNH